MSKSENDNKLESHVRSLKKALADAKNKAADRMDVVVDMKEAERARLEILAEELRPLINDIDDADERFEFGLTKGDKPRLWIDMTSFVAMGHDKRRFRFLKDSRMGRVVLAETDNMDKMADIISEYVADKVLEREQILEGEWVSQKSVPTSVPVNVSQEVLPRQKKKQGGWRGTLWFLIGAICSAAALAAAAFFLVPDAF